MTELIMRDSFNRDTTQLTLPVLTPRQDRLKAAIFEVLRAGGTRSELRELVEQFSDYLQMQDVPLEHALSVLRELGSSATPFMNVHGTPAVGDSAVDRTAMMIRWCADRYRAS